MDVGLITVLMFGLMLLLLAVGLPVAFVLGGTAVFFAIFAWGPDAMNILVLNANSAMSATVLVAVPLFVFMAYMLQEAGIADDLYGAMHIWMGPLNGGLAAGTILASTIVAAMSGISTTGVILMGVIGLPSMLLRKYDKGIAMGSIMAGGALGSLIPPSILMIVYALLSGVSVGKLFLACVLPGLILSTFFITFILVRCYFNPSIGPALPAEERYNFFEKLRSIRGLVIPILLVIAVLGSIFGGFATPTEAAGVGAFGTILSTAFHRKLTWKNLKAANLRTLKTVVMVMWVVYAAGCFTSIYQGLGVTALVKDGWKHLHSASGLF